MENDYNFFNDMQEKIRNFNISYLMTALYSQQIKIKIILLNVKVIKYFSFCDWVSYCSFRIDIIHVKGYITS